jgi:Flp pilus assembly protein CpaB
MEKKRSPLLVIAIAIGIGLLVIALLNGTIRPASVVVAKESLAPGTILTTDLVELRSVPAGGIPAEALRKLEEVEGQSLSVGRAPGDFITSSVLGDASASGIPSQLAPGHVAMSVRVSLASGVAGLVRAGQTVTVIGMLSPDVIQDSGIAAQPASPAADLALENPYAVGMETPTPTPSPTPVPPSAPIARIAISGLKVLLVPQNFRYEELPPSKDSNEALFSSANSSAASKEGSVIVLDVPVGTVEIKPGMLVNPAALLAALDQYGKLYLAPEPANGLQSGDILTLNLGELYKTLNEK